MNVIITGASRGIGLELCRVGLEKSHRILAVARTPPPPNEKLQTLALDLTADNAPELIGKAAGELWPHVDLLINNAGIYRGDDTVENFLQSYRVNSVTPFFVTRALLPLLKKAAAPKVVHITSLMGSISDNSSGGAYAYRSSKSALNMINKSLTVDQPWLTTAVLHPGWVQTDMGGQNAPVKVGESAAGLWRVIDQLEHAKTGHFYDYRGRELAW